MEVNLSSGLTDAIDKLEEKMEYLKSLPMTHRIIAEHNKLRDDKDRLTCLLWMLAEESDIDG